MNINGSCGVVIFLTVPQLLLNKGQPQHILDPHLSLLHWLWFCPPLIIMKIKAWGLMRSEHHPRGSCAVGITHGALGQWALPRVSCTVNISQGAHGQRALHTISVTVVTNNRDQGTLLERVLPVSTIQHCGAACCSMSQSY